MIIVFLELAGGNLHVIDTIWVASQWDVRERKGTCSINVTCMKHRERKCPLPLTCQEFCFQDTPVSRQSRCVLALSRLCRNMGAHRDWWQRQQSWRTVLLRDNRTPRPRVSDVRSACGRRLNASALWHPWVLWHVVFFVGKTGICYRRVLFWYQDKTCFIATNALVLPKKLAEVCFEKDIIYRKGNL